MFTTIPLYPPSGVMYTLDRGDTMQGLLIITKVNNNCLCRNIFQVFNIKPLNIVVNVRYDDNV